MKKSKIELPTNFWVRWRKGNGRVLTYIATRVVLDNVEKLQLRRPAGMVRVGEIVYEIDKIREGRAKLLLGAKKHPADAWWGDPDMAIWPGAGVISDVMVRPALGRNSQEGFALRMMYDLRSGFEGFMTEDAARQLYVQLRERLEETS